MLTRNPNATVIEADARNITELVRSPDVSRLLDFSQPVGVLVVALLHFIPDDATADQIMTSLYEVAAPGSLFVFSHALSEPTAVLTPEGLDAAENVYQRSTAAFAARTRSQIERLVAPLELAEPGLVYLPLWRPEGPDDVLLDKPERSSALACVGRKR